MDYEARAECWTGTVRWEENKFAWSVMLPQPGKIYGIRYVNELVSAFCHENNFDLLWTNEYSVSINGPDSVRSLFARDGVHLNRGGIAIMSKTVNTFSATGVLV